MRRFSIDLLRAPSDAKDDRLKTMDRSQTSDLRVDRQSSLLALGFGLAAFCLHALFAARYDIFRDELYFIVCGRHPDLGYADQPPLVPLLAAGFYSLGHSLWCLRLPSTLAAAALAWLSVKFVFLLKGDRTAAVLAGLAVTIAPMLMGISATLNTTSFDPLAWTLIAFFLVRALKAEDHKDLLFAGLVAGLDLEIKYALVFWGISLFLGLLLTRERRLLTHRGLWFGLALAGGLALPSFIWQAFHSFPFLELAHAARAKNSDTPPLDFLLNQVLVMSPLLAPLWICGVLAPFWLKPLKGVQFLSIAFISCFLLTLLVHGKDYYIAATYPVMFITGAVAATEILQGATGRLVLTFWTLMASAFSVWIAPLALPVLPVKDLKAFILKFPLRPQAQEKSFKGTLLPQVFADQLGWHDYVNQVGTAWLALPKAERAKTAIKVDNYGEAAALDVYGKPFGLPPALSGHNQYFLWGLRGQNPENLLVVQNNPERLSPYCKTSKVISTTYSPDAMAYENGKAIAYCQGLKIDLKAYWPQIKDYN